MPTTTTSPSHIHPKPIHTHTSNDKNCSPPSSLLPICSTCSNPFSPPSPSSFPANSLVACRKCGTYVKPNSFDYHYRLTHSPHLDSFHTCPSCLPSLTKPVPDNPATPPPKSSTTRMFERENNTHKLSTDPAAFAAAAAAAQAAASHQMSSAQHQHLSSAAAAAAAAASTQFALPVHLSSDPAHPTYSAPPAAHSHLFDRSDQPHHSLGLSQSPPVFASQHQSTHHHHHHHHHQQQQQQQSQQQHRQQQQQQVPPPPQQQQQQQPQQHHQQAQQQPQPQPQPPQAHHTHIQPAKTHRPHHQDLPSASQPQSQSHQQHPLPQSRKGKRIATSTPTAALPRTHRPASMSNPADHSQQHTVTMVAQDGHTFSRLAAPSTVNVAHPPDNRNESPLRNDPLYPHIAARPTHPQQQAQQHQPIVSSVVTHPEQHITIQSQSAPQQHHTGLRNVTASFTGGQLSDNRVQAVTRLSFEEESRRRTGNAQTPSQQNTAVMLQFPESYIPQQQEGINDNRQRVMNISEPVAHHQRDGQPRFEGDPGTLVGPGMAYEIKEGEIDQKRLGTNGTTGQEGVLTSGGLDPSAINRQPNLMTTHSAARLGPDGRPLNPSVFMHGTVEKRVACESCGLLFGDVGSLKRHAARSHRAATGKGPVYCPQCNASLKNEQNLRRHIAVCHSGDQENRCDMCNASFSSRGSLRIHQQQVHNVPPGSKGGRSGRGGRGGGRGGRGGGINKSTKSDKSYVCDMCTDTFKWKGNLKRHRELRHLHLRPFFCQICNASFGTKSNMRVHLITHNNAQNK